MWNMSMLREILLGFNVTFAEEKNLLVLEISKTTKSVVLERIESTFEGRYTYINQRSWRFENKRLLSTFCQMVSISLCFWFTFLSNLDINRKVACLFNEGGGLISRSLLLCYLWIRVEMTCTLLLLYKMYGVCFDDNSQNNIMSDIDKHHSDSYSCPGASVHKNFSIGIIIEG